MITAVDSSVVIQLLRRQPGWEAWQAKLTIVATEGPLVICPVVFAECAVGYPSTAAAIQEFETIQLHFDDIFPESAYLAGQTFNRYRQARGPREHLIPDFLIAAHAQTQADRLAAIDRGYLRQWFPNLKLLTLGSDP